MKRLAAVWSWLDLDRLDLLLAAGILSLWRGLSLWSEAAAWTACGMTLLAFCFVGIMRR